jgi:hypothetical protein
VGEAVGIERVLGGVWRPAGGNQDVGAAAVAPDGLTFEEYDERMEDEDEGQQDERPAPRFGRGCSHGCILGIATLLVGLLRADVAGAPEALFVRPQHGLTSRYIQRRRCYTPKCSQVGERMESDGPDTVGTPSPSYTTEIAFQGGLTTSHALCSSFAFFAYSQQRTIGCGGYFGNRRSCCDNWQSKNVEPLRDTISRQR